MKSDSCFLGYYTAYYAFHQEAHTFSTVGKTTETIWKILEIVDSLKPKCVLRLHRPASMNGTFLVLFRERANQEPTRSDRTKV